MIWYNTDNSTILIKPDFLPIIRFLYHKQAVNKSHDYHNSPWLSAWVWERKNSATAWLSSPPHTFCLFLFRPISGAVELAGTKTWTRVTLIMKYREVDAKKWNNSRPGKLGLYCEHTHIEVIGYKPTKKAHELLHSVESVCSGELIFCEKTESYARCYFSELKLRLGRLILQIKFAKKISCICT